MPSPHPLFSSLRRMAAAGACHARRAGAALCLATVSMLWGCRSLPQRPPPEPGPAVAPSVPAPLAETPPHIGTPVMLVPTPPPIGRGADRLPSAKVQPPRLTVRRDPSFPPELIDAGVQGRVVAQLAVEASGRVGEVRIDRSSHPLFERAVRAVLPHWRFEPARDAAGMPQRALVRQVFSFRLEE